MKLYSYLPLDTPGLDQPSQLHELRLSRDPSTAAQVALRTTPTTPLHLVVIDIDDDPAERFPLRCDLELLFDQSWTPLHHRIETMSRVAVELDPHAVHESMVPIDEHAWTVSLAASGTCLTLGGHHEWLVSVSAEPTSYEDLEELADVE